MNVFSSKIFSCSKIVTEVACETAAALAAASLVFRANGETAYANTLVTHATQLYAFGNNFRGSYSVSFPEVAQFYKLETKCFTSNNEITNAFVTVPGVDLTTNYCGQLLGFSELRVPNNIAQTIIISGYNSA